VAFTLIELLVVIAIITLLVSIVSPSYSRIRKYAKQTQCMMNLKGQGTAFQIYLDEHPKQIPVASSFPTTPPPGQEEPICIADVMDKYAGAREIWKCPTDDLNYFEDYGTSYEYLPGMILIDESIWQQVMSLADEHADKIMLFADADAFHPTPQDPNARLCVYYDGHVDWMLDEEEAQQAADDVEE
jgi:prepilin-type N-terminal cleavage/methylation domain-containing protein